MEFVPVILAGGGGSRMYPLSETPKALLPVANRPLISYSLELLERSGFTSVFVLVEQAYGQPLRQALEQLKNKLHVDLVILPEECTGTADALRHVADKIKSDFLVLSVDLITDVFVHHVADVHRVNDATVTCLFKDTSAVEKEVANAKAQRQKGYAVPSMSIEARSQWGSLEYVGLDKSKSRVLYLRAAADVDTAIPLRKSLLARYPDMALHRNMCDAHFYIFSKSVLDVLRQRPSIASIKGELVPYLIHKQFRRSGPSPGPGTQSVSSPAGVDSDNEAVRRASLATMATNASVLASQRQAISMSPVCYDSEDRVRCYSYVTTGYCVRVNTVAAYQEANRDVARRAVALMHLPREPLLKDKFVDESAQIHQRSTLGPDCVVGAMVTMGEKGSAKKSVIGAHCQIGAGCKLTNCIVMDHVTIGDGCTLTNVVIGTSAHIGAKSTLSNCQVGNKSEVEDGAKLKGEQITAEPAGAEL